MKLFQFATALAALAILGACGSSNNRPADQNSDKLEFRTYSCSKAFILEDTAQEFCSDSDLVVCNSASVIMPEQLLGRNIDNLQRRIIELAFDTVCADPLTAMNEALRRGAESIGYSVVETTDTTARESAEGFASVEGNILNLTDKRLTYCINRQYYYPGAAHGMYSRNYITYDLTDGDIVSLESLFTPNGLEQLPTYIGNRAKRLVAQLGPTTITSLPEEGNFYISLNDEIVFVYQPYEVASYAQGIINVPFYPYELSELLSPQGLKFFGIDR